MHIQGSDGVRWHPPTLALQGVWEAAGEGEGETDSGQQEKLIVDNKLCPFCLLHDKDKPCGAKQRPASVACTASGCRGRHAQKLHDFLKDVFREEGRVHVLQETMSERNQKRPGN